LLAVTKGESAADFEFIFGALHEFQLQWTPSILLADGSDAITNGFAAVFGPPRIRLMCFFQVREKVEAYLKPLTKNGVCVQIKNDLHALQVCKG